MSESPYPPIEAMLPHRDPFLFIRSVIGEFEDRIVCRAVINEGHYLSHRQSAPAILGIEMGAQAAGVLSALRHIEHGSTGTAPQVGYLVGIRHARFHAETLPVGRQLRVEARSRGGAGPLSTFEVQVAIEGKGAPLVEARISTWAEQELDT